MRVYVLDLVISEVSAYQRFLNCIEIYYFREMSYLCLRNISFFNQRIFYCTQRNL